MPGRWDKEVRMDAIWIAGAMVVAVVGGWPVTAGFLKLARSQAVRAVDAAESGGPAAGEPAAVDAAESGGPAAGEPADGPGAAGTEAAAEGMPPAPPGAPVGNGPDNGASGVAAPGQGQAAPAQTQAAPARPEAPAAPLPRTDILRGGLLIGFLERGAVALAIFSGQPVAIAYVVAIKGLGRYPELKETPGASERFIIGTLASMLWAASVGVLTKVLLL